MHLHLKPALVTVSVVLSLLVLSAPFSAYGSELSWTPSIDALTRPDWLSKLPFFRPSATSQFHNAQARQIQQRTYQLIDRDRERNGMPPLPVSRKTQRIAELRMPMVARNCQHWNRHGRLYLTGILRRHHIRHWTYAGENTGSGYADGKLNEMTNGMSGNQLQAIGLTPQELTFRIHSARQFASVINRCFISRKLDRIDRDEHRDNILDNADLNMGVGASYDVRTKHVTVCEEFQLK